MKKISLIAALFVPTYCFAMAPEQPIFSQDPDTMDLTFNIKAYENVTLPGYAGIGDFFAHVANQHGYPIHIKWLVLPDSKYPYEIFDVSITNQRIAFSLNNIRYGVKRLRFSGPEQKATYSSMQSNEEVMAELFDQNTEVNPIPSATFNQVAIPTTLDERLAKIVTYARSGMIFRIDHIDATDKEATDVIVYPMWLESFPGNPKKPFTPYALAVKYRVNGQLFSEIRTSPALLSFVADQL